MENYENDFEEVRELLKKKDNGKYNTLYIFRQLHEKENLRIVFLSLIKENPARISEISEEALLTKPTCYSQLHILIKLGLVDRIFVMSIINGVIKNEAIKNKFNEWIKTMPKQ